MIKDFFLNIYYFTVIKIEIINTNLIIQIKIPSYTYKLHIKYIFYQIYKIKPKSLNIKNYNKNYKILIIKYKI